LSGIWASIDKVAEDHEQGLSLRLLVQIVTNFRQQVVEEIQAAMNVANDIGAPAPCAGRTMVPPRKEIRHNALYEVARY
jgi:hypothetical protein